ncbi:MAG: radical SAM protein [Candidatus Omnitrophica bacterium]|nr:radical SAM protein [Candidatus Omnitrophota bacterium]MBD3269398.1 radical SAM protein [Candidatus Omnitrophota bacterium]
MDILIINPPVRLNDKPRHIPHGLAIISRLIKRHLNIVPTFLDINAYRYTEDEIKKILEAADFDIVLIGGIASTYGQIISLSNLIKRVNPDSKIIAGGYAVMCIPEVLLKNSEVDIVCTGEGEITVIELLKALEKDLNTNLSGIKGICYKTNNRKEKIVCNPPRTLIDNLDEQSTLPDYEAVPMNIYLSNPTVGFGKDVDFISSRGCPYRCTFCYQPWGHKPRFHSVDFIMDCIALLKKDYDIDFIAFQDDEFMANERRVYEFCKAKKAKFPDLLWSCTGRVNIVARNEDIIVVMKEAGCVSISYGFESGAQVMLNRMRKGITVEQIEDVISISRKHEMPVPASFIIGMPGETERTCKETLDFCLKNNLNLDSLMFATPYQGSEIFYFALKTGRIDKNRIHDFLLKLGDARDFIINLTDAFSDEELIQKRKEMMEVASENYKNFITSEEIYTKTKNLFGPLLEKYSLDEGDLQHRAKHGSMSTF